ncbi:MAG: hypothetical protein IKW38_05440 [Kiritimatiellae bacterium]|nr:hypothetical protein [Kiritimatiellia bacterium]
MRQKIRLCRRLRHAGALLCLCDAFVTLANARQLTVALGSVTLNFFFEVACAAACLLEGCGTLQSFYGVNFGVVFL